MKKIFSFFAVFLLVLFSAFEFSSCVVEGDSSGSVRVALPGNSRGAFVFNEEAASYFELNLKGVGIDRSEIGYAGTIVSFDNIPVGDYDLDVTVFADNHIAFASGSRKVTVRANSSELVEITAHMLYGMKLGSSILDSNYYLFGRSESGLEYVIPEVEDFAASISPSSMLKGTVYTESLIFTVAKDSFYYSTYAAPCKRSDGKVVSISRCPETFDVYYEDVNDRVWCFGKTDTNIKYFALTSKEFNVAATTECTGSGDFPDSLLNLYCIAAKDDRVYVAYNNTNYELMIQTYIAEESGNLIKAGNAVQVSLPGMSDSYHNEITDMQVMYDGNLYVLVRDYTQDSSSHYYVFDSEDITTGEYWAYSRGAIIKYSTAGNVLNMEKILGWTKNPKVMTLPSGLIPDLDTYYFACKKLNAYIPEVGDFSNSFLGPMRFIAVKPKELVVADFGLNVWLADDKKKINGGMKFHSRAVSVDLASFAIRDICEFTNFNFDNPNANSSGPVFTYSELSDEYSRDGEY